MVTALLSSRCHRHRELPVLLTEGNTVAPPPMSLSLLLLLELLTTVSPGPGSISAWPWGLPWLKELLSRVVRDAHGASLCPLRPFLLLGSEPSSFMQLLNLA